MQALAQRGYTVQEVLDALQGRSGSRRMSFRYELLDSTNTYIADLTNVRDCSISQDTLADIKRSARFTLSDDRSVNYLSNRIKPWARVALPAKPKTYQASVTPLTGMLLRWRFNETSGTVAADSSGNSRSGTIGGSVVLNRPGLLATGSAFGFSSAGTASQVAVGSTTWLQGLSRLTLLAWVRSSAVGVTRGIVVGRLPDGTASLDLQYMASGTIGAAANCIRARVSVDTGAGIQVLEGYTLASTQTTEVQMVAMTWQSGVGIRVFINGLPVALSGQSTNFGSPGVTSTNVNALVAGRGGAVGQDWVGDITQVAVLSSVVPDASIWELYRTGLQTGPYGTDNYAEWPQGVYLLSTPSRKVDDTETVTRDVEAYDALVVYRDDLVDNRYAAAVGASYTTLVSTLLGSVAKNVTPSSLTLTTAREWEPGTSKLAIINNLLGAINYESLFFDESGTAVARPYQSPSTRGSEYLYADDSTSVISPDVEQSLDLFNVANKWVLVVSEADLPIALRSTYTNSSPGSPTSTVSRGRTIVDFRTEQDAPDQATLDAKVARLAFEASQVYEVIVFSTAIMPFHSHSDVYTIQFSPLALGDKYGEQSWEMPLRAGAKMSHRARRVVTL